MRILHILDHSIPLQSGYTFRTRAILREQRALGWETFHITSPKHNLALPTNCGEETVDGLHFYRTPVPGRWGNRVPVLKQWRLISAIERRISQVIDVIRPDIIHAHSPALNAVAAARVCKRTCVPMVYEIRAFWEDAAVDHGTSTEWGIRYRLSRALETHAIKCADAVTTICEGLRGEIVRRGIPDSKVTVIPNAVDLSRFTVNRNPDTELAKDLGLAGKVVLGFIGSFYAYEGLHLLLHALPRILAVMPSVRVLLVGGGPEEDRLRQLASKLGVQNEIVFTGRVSHGDVHRYYNLVDVFIYPRLPMRLTELVTPLKPLEAMANGRLVVASDVGGHRELISDHRTGILFRAGSVDDLVRVVVALLTDRASWTAVQTRARSFVERERSWPAVVSRYRSVYQSIASRGAGAGRQSDVRA